MLSSFRASSVGSRSVRGGLLGLHANLQGMVPFRRSFLGTQFFGLDRQRTLSLPGSILLVRGTLSLRKKCPRGDSGASR